MNRTSLWEQANISCIGFENTNMFVSSIPDTLLRAEITRRNSNDHAATCGSKERGVYNTKIHVLALFLILVLSTLACSFPVLARRFPRLPVPRRFLFLSRHFGTGVLIATAFVHLLPTAFVSLTDPCLPRFWSETYRAMAGFVAMISVFVVVLVEMFFALKGAGHLHGSEYDQLINDASVDLPTLDLHDDLEDEQEPAHSVNPGRLGAYHRADAIPTLSDPSLSSSTDGPALSNSRNHGMPTDCINLARPHYHNTFDRKSDRIHRRSSSSDRHSHADMHQRTNMESPRHNPQRQLLQCLLLEAGILFHSIFIGMALSVATGTSFIVLLVAICFHQTFEGFALGSRIASLIPDLFAPSSMRPWLMSLAYGTTTPIGQAIGLILHNFYDPASTTGLLMVGITNAISSGLLLFAGLVELLAEDFLSEPSYATLRGRRRVEACVAVMAGALLMAFVGAFA
ncbi:putative ZIP family zinc transporter [Aspergillus saccharolyticus JOP 1030-1]|uniref:Zinc/iron permease n=1 Tax=Aspergillus saccharolyticus JOP 1030-1 TaxID=1450539 RepID=A0A318ZGL4_9EURO|nr:Zinc/iron permease [Aspergillus saccharolyticus JOP 1030-1]PYH46691.1 Zinc/iron permease [Aspergillus saccharolyticus JOP 1030-1]